MEICVWLPDLLYKTVTNQSVSRCKVLIRTNDDASLTQHLDIETELVDVELVGVHLETLEAESAVSPVLPEVAVHGVVLNHKYVKHCLILCPLILTMSMSDMGPMLRMRMLTFTSVGPVYKKFSVVSSVARLERF